MKRFIDLRGQGTMCRFAWWDTVRDEFEEFSGEQAWDTWDTFAAVCPEPACQERYKPLCPAWVFEPYTEADEDAETDAFVGLPTGKKNIWIAEIRISPKAVEFDYREDKPYWNIVTVSLPMHQLSDEVKAAVEALRAALGKVVE